MCCWTVTVWRCTVWTGLHCLYWAGAGNNPNNRPSPPNRPSLSPSLCSGSFSNKFLKQSSLFHSPRWTLQPLDDHLSCPFRHWPTPLWCHRSFGSTHPRPPPLLCFFFFPSCVFVSHRHLCPSAAICRPCYVPAFTLPSPPLLSVRIVVWEGVVQYVFLSALYARVCFSAGRKFSDRWVFFSFLNCLVLLVFAAFWLFGTIEEHRGHSVVWVCLQESPCSAPPFVHIFLATNSKGHRQLAWVLHVCFRLRHRRPTRQSGKCQPASLDRWGYFLRDWLWVSVCEVAEV